MRSPYGLNIIDNCLICPVREQYYSATCPRQLYKNCLGIICSRPASETSLKCLAVAVESNPIPPRRYCSLPTKALDALTGKDYSVLVPWNLELFLGPRKVLGSLMIHAFHAAHGLLVLHGTKMNFVCDELVARNIGMDGYLVPDL